jgi:hypothetical protein
MDNFYYRTYFYSEACVKLGFSRSKSKLGILYTLEGIGTSCAVVNQLWAWLFQKIKQNIFSAQTATFL